MNPPEWKDLWLLSPFSVVEGGVAVPGLPGVRSATVENAWQFLKVWPDEDGWQREDAMAAFASTCAIRYPRGPKAKAIGSYWGEDRSVISYVQARKRIYVPAYLEMLSHPDRAQLVDRLRQAAMERAMWIWDFDSYDVSQVGMSDILDAIAYEARPFAHAFLVALAMQRRLDALPLSPA